MTEGLIEDHGFRGFSSELSGSLAFEPVGKHHIMMEIASQVIHLMARMLRKSRKRAGPCEAMFLIAWNFPLSPIC